MTNEKFYGSKILRGADDSFTVHDSLQKTFPTLNLKETALMIKLFLRYVSKVTEGEVQGFQSEIEFDEFGLIKAGRENTPHVLLMFGISLREFSDIRRLFEGLGDGQSFSLGFEEVSKTPHRVRLTIAKRRGVEQSRIRDAKDGDRILSEAFAKRRMDKIVELLKDKDA